MEIRAIADCKTSLGEGALGRAGQRSIGWTASATRCFGPMLTARTWRNGICRRKSDPAAAQRAARSLYQTGLAFDFGGRHCFSTPSRTSLPTLERRQVDGVAASSSARWTQGRTRAPPSTVLIKSVVAHRKQYHRFQRACWSPTARLSISPTRGRWKSQPTVGRVDRYASRKRTFVAFDKRQRGTGVPTARPSC